MSELQDKYLSLFAYQDGQLFWRVNRGSQLCKGKPAGTPVQNGYTKVRIREMGGSIGAHRIIFCMEHGYLPDYVDHINGNKSDNRIENLRAATKAENCQNAKMPTTNTSGIKNVFWNKLRNKWAVALTVKNARKFFGLFDDIELAELVAQEARNKYHGKFANHGVTA